MFFVWYLIRNIFQSLLNNNTLVISIDCHRSTLFHLFYPFLAGDIYTHWSTLSLKLLRTWISLCIFNLTIHSVLLASQSQLLSLLVDFSVVTLSNWAFGGNDVGNVTNSVIVLFVWCNFRIYFGIFKNWRRRLILVKIIGKLLLLTGFWFRKRNWRICYLRRIRWNNRELWRYWMIIAMLFDVYWSFFSRNHHNLLRRGAVAWKILLI